VIVEQISQYPLLWNSLLIILGLLVGSFLNVVILRLPISMEHEWKSQCRELLAESPDTETDNEEIPPNIVFPASFCPQCKATLKWWQNIPLLSYLLLRGKCHACQQAIPLRYPAIELLTAALTWLAGTYFPQTLALPWILVALWLLIAMSVIDLDTQLLPDNLTLPLLWLGLLYSIAPGSPVSPVDAILGAAAGYMALWLIFQVHYFITRRQGMGYGDFKLLAACGAWLGWQTLPFVLLIAAVSGLVIAITLMMLRNHDLNRAIPFGPYLAIAFVIILFWGDPMIAAYFGMTGITL
jgi:leader peptidase (prepilin peptidase)/N-methyltransferase